MKQVINFNDNEGQPVSLDVCGNSLVIATSNGVLRVYDLSRRYDVVDAYTRIIKVINR